MGEQVFLHLGSADISTCIAQAKNRIFLCMSGLNQPNAAAVVNASKRLGRNAVSVVLDVDEKVSQRGYGEFEAVMLLLEGEVDVRLEKGLRVCVLIVDDQGYTFFSPPMLVETQDEDSVGVNALKLHPAQIEAITMAFGQPREKTSPEEIRSSEPQIGAQIVTPQKIEAVREALNSSPPQKFDLARKVNVFNAFIEFVELRLIGLHIGKYTVQLPKEPLHKTPTHVLAHACRVRQHPGLCNKLISA